MPRKFPTNPYEDIKPSEFNKDNKKHASEYFVAENFKRYGWEVYEPFTDTGIDRIIQKKVCPDGHTMYSFDTRNMTECPECEKELVKITRFVQIKTREIVDLDYDDPLHGKFKMFGFTLSSNDFRTDPRHVFLLYSDNTTKELQDVHIIPINQFLEYMIEHDALGKSMFATKGFRQGNGKQNFLHYDLKNDSWCVNPAVKYTCKECGVECYWSSRTCKSCGKETGRSKDKSYLKDITKRAPRRIVIQDEFEDFRNENGLQLISTLDIEKNFQTLQNDVSKNKIKLFFDSSKAITSTIKTALENHKDSSFPQEIQKLRASTLEIMKKSLPPHLKESIEKGYWIKFKELRGKLE